MDYDTYTAHDAIGKVGTVLFVCFVKQFVYFHNLNFTSQYFTLLYLGTCFHLQVNISLNCLLTRDAPSSMKGWFPIYDTMHGKSIKK